MFDFDTLEAPIIQAGMGLIARHELAAAVSQAGGLGTIAVPGPSITDELKTVRRLTDRPLAVNLLLPFARPDDIRAAADADVLVTRPCGLQAALRGRRGHDHHRAVRAWVAARAAPRHPQRRHKRR